MARLRRQAFNRPTLRVARNLLGKFLVRARRGRRIEAMITEVEAYKAPADRASHAYGGRRTPRTEPLYGPAGTAYVHLTYGIHWLLNLSTAAKGRPESVLIRAAIMVRGGRQVLLKGPGVLTRGLEIDGKLQGVDLTRSRELWIEDRGARVRKRDIRTGPRVGVEGAGPYWSSRPWRYWIDAPPRPP